MIFSRIGILAIVVVAVALSACFDSSSHARAVFVLIDTSGTYAKEIDKAQRIIDYLLAELNPGDSLAVARIDSASFSERDIIASMTFSDRPSVANGEKRQFRKRIDDFARTVQGSQHTDISGGLLQAIGYLDETRAGKRYILVFSDMKEDLQKGHVRDIQYNFANTQVVALHVTKLSSDSRNPKEYVTRLENWQRLVEGGGGQWRIINDFTHLASVFTG